MIKIIEMAIALLYAVNRSIYNIDSEISSNLIQYIPLFCKKITDLICNIHPGSAYRNLV